MITVTAFVGMLGISTGMEGFMKTRLKAWERILCIAAGLLLIKPGTLTDVIGIVVIVGMFVIQNMKVKRTQQA